GPRPVRRAVPLAPLHAQARAGAAAVRKLGAVCLGDRQRPRGQAQRRRRRQAGLRPHLGVLTMILLEHHKQAKSEIVTRFQQLAEVADSVGMVTLARDIRTTRIPKLEAERFHLVVLGEFNHGKSTFVNAMLGSDALPTGITPTTASINHVVWGGNPAARVV